MVTLGTFPLIQLPQLCSFSPPCTAKPVTVSSPNVYSGPQTAIKTNESSSRPGSVPPAFVLSTFFSQSPTVRLRCSHSEQPSCGLLFPHAFHPHCPSVCRSQWLCNITTAPGPHGQTSGVGVFPRHSYGSGTVTARAAPRFCHITVSEA